MKTISQDWCNFKGKKILRHRGLKKWVDELNLKLSDGTECFFTHGMSADGLKLAMQYGKNVCQFHFHSKFNIQYFSNPDSLVWSLQCGCLTKQSSLAFEYSKNFRLRFVIGLSLIHI